jgi:ABC-type Na+ efflux pump permease subunit
VSVRSIARLVRKDIFRMRLPLFLYTFAALGGLALAALPVSAARMAGILLAVNVMIAVSFHILFGTVLGERERKTLAFVLSLPVTPREVAAGKILSSFLSFLAPGTAAATALVFLSPVDIFAAMASDGRPLLSHLLGWLAYFALVLGAWALFFSIVLAVALLSESLGWTIAVLTGLIFVVGNAALQLAPRIGWFVRYGRSLARGGPELPLTLGAVAVGISLVLGATFWLQGRKTSFL